MRLSPAQSAALPLLALVGLLTLAPAAHAGQVEVVPPGQEGLILEMFGKGEVLPGGCRLQDARVLRTYVVGTWACDAGEATVELRPLASAPAGAATTAKLAVAGKGALPDGLLDAVVARVRERDARWHWMKVRAETEPVGRMVPTEPPPPSEVESREIDPAVLALYDQGKALQAEGRHDEAIAAFVQVARKNPRLGGVLGMIVANVAQTHPDAERVERWAAAAEAAQDDALASFIAGVGAHYSAHYGAATPEEKRALYERAVHWLERAEEPFSFEPRVFIYLAVSHFRLGHQEKAEALIERAIALDANDPDAYYCRAEIKHRSDPKTALVDLDKYLEMASVLAEPGNPVAEAKMDRVRGMRTHLEDVLAGRASEDELFDPLARSAAQEAPPSGLAEALRSSPLFAWVVVFAGLLALAVAWKLVRRRRRDQPPP